MMVGFISTPEPMEFVAPAVQFEVLSPQVAFALSELEIVDLEALCSCVDYARQLGVDFPRIRTPADLQPNSIPVAGAIILIDYPGYPHMGVIADPRPGAIIYKEQRLFDGKCIAGFNWITHDDPKFRGVYKQSL